MIHANKQAQNKQTTIPTATPFGKVRHNFKNRIMARVYVRSITHSTMHQKAPFC